MYGRLVDRSSMLTSVLRSLDRETLVLACQRLGYCNVFCAHRPALWYQLRMRHAGEAHVAHKLYKLACKHGPQAIKYLAVDGDLKKAPAGPCATSEQRRLYTLLSRCMHVGNPDEARADYAHSWLAALWTIMRGNAPQDAAKICTVKIDFVCEDACQLDWASRVVQQAWLSWRMRTETSLSLGGRRKQFALR